MSEPTAGAPIGSGAITLDHTRTLAILRNVLVPDNRLSRFEMASREAIQNAADATRAGIAQGLPAAPVALSLENGDLVIRDHGTGMLPSDFEKYILKVFSSGKGEGIGGFGAGALSMMYGSSEVIVKTRKPGGELGEFRQSWINERGADVLPAAEAEAFGHGTEVRLVDVVNVPLSYGVIGEDRVRATVKELVATSQMRNGMAFTWNGAPLKQAFILSDETRRTGGEFQETFPGGRIHHHVITKPADLDPDIRWPRTFVMATESLENGDYLTQRAQFLSESDCSYAMVVESTVRPDDPRYAHTPDRNDFAVKDVREILWRVQAVLATEGLSARDQATWKRVYYTGSDLPPVRPVTDAQVAVLQLLAKHNVKRAEATADLLRRVVPGATSLLEESATELPEAHDELRPLKRGWVSEQSHLSQTTALASALAGEPGLVLVHTQWERPEGMPQEFDPLAPESIERLTPLLVAMRAMGSVVRDSAQEHDRWAYRRDHSPVYYGFVFDPKSAALFERGGDKLGANASCIMVNPAASALRRANSKAAMCDVLTGLLRHEVTHIGRSGHDESFSTLTDDISFSLANRRDDLQAIFAASGAYEVIRELNGQTVSPAERRDSKEKTRTVPRAVARFTSLENVEQWDITRDLRLGYTGDVVADALYQMAKDPVSKPAKAGAAAAEIMTLLANIGELNADALVSLRTVADRLGVPLDPKVIAKAGKFGAAERAFQTRVLKATVDMEGLDQLRSGYARLAAPGAPVLPELADLSADMVSPARYVAAATYACNAASGDGPFAAAGTAIYNLRSFTSSTIIEELDDAAMRAETAEEKATLASDEVALVTAVALVQRNYGSTSMENKRSAAAIIGGWASTGKVPTRPRAVDDVPATVQSWAALPQGRGRSR